MDFPFSIKCIGGLKNLLKLVYKSSENNACVLLAFNFIALKNTSKSDSFKLSLPIKLMLYLRNF